MINDFRDSSFFAGSAMMNLINITMNVITAIAVSAGNAKLINLLIKLITLSINPV
jgi:hypothetical protein